MVEHRIQNLDSVSCGIFQLYFCDNLFNPDEDSKIQGKVKLNKKTIETLLNELFVLDDQETNEATIRQYAKDNSIFMAQTQKAEQGCKKIKNLILSYL